MRTFYGSDKKKREDTKRKKQEQKRLKRLNKNSPANRSSDAETEPAPDAKVVESDESV